MFDVLRTIELKSSSGEFIEKNLIQPVAISAGLTAITLVLDGDCTGECSTVRQIQGSTVWPLPTSQTPVTITDTHTWQRSSTSNVRDDIVLDQSFSLKAMINGQMTTTTKSNLGRPELKVRCDSEVLGYPGCVFSGYIANLTVDTAEYPVAASMYWILQEKLKNHPGSIKYGSPVHRLADTTKHKSNRDVMCDLRIAAFDPYPGRGTPGFPLPEMPEPSCDEYPFAAVRESGGMTLTSGSQCVQLYAHKVSGRWTIDFDPRYSLPKVVNGLWDNICGRGTIPLDQNRAAGGGVGGIVSKYRVLDNEPYYVRLPEVESCGADTTCNVD